MIQFVQNADIIKKKWDDCIAHSVNERIYAYSWYLNIVAPNWDALIMDDYQAVFPVVHQKKWVFHILTNLYLRSSLDSLLPSYSLRNCSTHFTKTH